MVTDGDTANFFKRVDVNEEYWVNYLSTRPEYGSTFYDLLYNFHRAHNGVFEVAHDIGTGPGQIAMELSKQFQNVVASDNNATHLAIAHQRLGALVTQQNNGKGIQLLQCPAENILDGVSANSTDLVVAGECMPLLNSDIVLKNCYSILKPGGTLAILFYGRPHFAEPEYADRCQPIFASILDTLFSRLIRGGGPEHTAAWKRATESMMSFLDNVDLSSTDMWTNTIRRKWNPQYQLSFNGISTCDFEVAVKSKIGHDKEEVIEIQDSHLWERQWDIQGVRTYVSGQMPTFDRTMFKDEGLESMFQDLTQAMGGKDAVRKITWPAVLILTSKK